MSVLQSPWPALVSRVHCLLNHKLRRLALLGIPRHGHDPIIGVHKHGKQALAMHGRTANQRDEAARIYIICFICYMLLIETRFYPRVGMMYVLV